MQAVVPEHDTDTIETLAARIAQEEHKLYPQAVRLFGEGRLQIVGRRVRVLPQGPPRETVGITEISEGEGQLG